MAFGRGQFGGSSVSPCAPHLSAVVAKTAAACFPLLGKLELVSFWSRSDPSQRCSSESHQGPMDHPQHCGAQAELVTLQSPWFCTPFVTGMALRGSLPGEAQLHRSGATAPQPALPKLANHY